MMRAWFCVVLLGCNGSARKDSPATTATPTATAAAGSDALVTKPKLGAPTSQATSWVQGAPLSPAAGLVLWLDAQTRDGEPRLVRIPIALPRGDTGYTLDGVRIGGGADAVTVYVVDTALGIGLANRALRCDGDTCPFLAEGYWRGRDEQGLRFEVRNASRAPLAAEAFAAITHAEVEGESGN